MKINFTDKRFSVSSAASIAATIVSCCLLQNAVAEELDTTAAVNLLLGLTVVENREVDFGELSGAAAGNCSMAINGTLTGSATGCVGTGVTGEFTIEGIRFFQVSVSVTPGSSDGITFTPTFFGGNTTLSGFLPATFGIFGAATLDVAGDISWAGTLSPGAKQIPFTLTADYN